MGVGFTRFVICTVGVTSRPSDPAEEAVHAGVRILEPFLFSRGKASAGAGTVPVGTEVGP